MPVRAKVESSIFTGVRNGRPHFDFGDHTAPPDWLLKLATNGRVDGQQFLVSGQPLQPGQVVTGV